MPDNNHSRGQYNQSQPRPAAVSSIAIWETQGAIKIFTGSHDGFWRLWNTQDSKFVKEFEHDMGGKVNCLEVASNFLFCGFESVTLVLPNVRVGMIHCWNLASPSDPPLEFHIQLNQIPYAHAMAVTRILVVGGDQVISGSQDGCIRVWRFDATAGGKGMFLLARTLHGHAREVTGTIAKENLTHTWLICLQRLTI
jgi:WD40 repeat protein